MTEAELAATVQELWHNLFRMHGYVEVALLACPDPGLKDRADAVLKASYDRVKAALPGIRHLEDPTVKGSES